MPRSSLLIFTKLKIGAQKLKSDIAQRACMSVSRAIVSSALVFHLFLLPHYYCYYTVVVRVLIV